MADKEKVHSNPTDTWGYYERLQRGPERDGIGEDWFVAGDIGEVSFKDTSSIQKMHQLLDSFNKVLLENPDDMRYSFVAVSSRTKLTSQNQGNDCDLILLIRPISDDVTLDDLRTFTSQVKGSQEQ